jgi:tetratricopeptide (TPR) repeat protein
MSTFQLLLLIISAAVFYLFFKQLLSGSFPKRGVDFEAKSDNDQIGSLTQIDKSFSNPAPRPSRVEQLLRMADESIEKEDYIEADKALSSALILDSQNIGTLLQHGYVLIQLNRLEEAKENYINILELDEHEDIAHVSLANVLHKLDENEKAIEHHIRAIELDGDYAPHYFNYANTLYDLGDKKEALRFYKRAFELDGSLEVADKMIKELS